jgi:4-hydroxy-2-oxoheptanedioate aldolase
MSIDTAVQISVAALDAGIAPFVRVPSMQHWMATRLLDGGALGVVMPHVDTAAQAAEVVNRLRAGLKKKLSDFS